MTQPSPGAPRRPLLSRRALLAAVVAVPALAAGVLVACDSEAEEQQTGPTKRIAQDKRSKAPEVNGTLLTGAAYDLATATAGKVVVINFWGSWCIPCRTEAPEFEAVYRQSRPRGVEFIGINVRDQVDPAKKFVSDFAVSYPSINDPGGRITLRFADVPPLIVPATLVIDRQGRIASITLSPLFREDLQALVDEVLAESPGELTESSTSVAPSSGPAG